MAKYKNVTVVITIKNFGIDTEFKPKDAILNALVKDLEGVNSFEEYFTDSSITLEVVDK